MTKPLKFCLFSIVATVFVSGASATVDDVIELQSGEWTWSHETKLAGIVFSEENTACLNASESRLHLSEVLSNLQPGCSLTSLYRDDDEYNYKVVCRGEVSGEATGTLLIDDGRLARLTADGSLRFADAEAGFEMIASAERTGVCATQ